jgi:hypothetical protein
MEILGAEMKLSEQLSRLYLSVCILLAGRHCLCAFHIAILSRKADPGAVRPLDEYNSNWQKIQMLIDIMNAFRKLLTKSGF